jgi:predicted transposase YdaD
MYDNVCKFLAETFPEELASWLLGQRIALTKLSPSELSLEPIRADSLILLQSSELVLHLEFQTETDPWIPLNTTEELPQRENLSAATGILAGLILNKNLM